MSAAYVGGPACAPAGEDPASQTAVQIGIQMAALGPMLWAYYGCDVVRPFFLCALKNSNMPGRFGATTPLWLPPGTSM